MENSVTLFSLDGKIYNGEIEFGEIEFETYDVDKMWADSSAINNNLPLENEMFRTPLNFSVEVVVAISKTTVRRFLLFSMSPHIHPCIAP